MNGKPVFKMSLFAQFPAEMFSSEYWRLWNSISSTHQICNFIKVSSRDRVVYIQDGTSGVDL